MITELRDDCLKSFENSDDTVCINVRGHRFEVFWTTLRKIPDLEDLIKTRGIYRHSDGEYYFDRDPDVFKCLMNYCRLGELHVPNTVCGPVLTKELHAWGIMRVDNIEYCCLMDINNSLMRLRNLKKFDDMFPDNGFEIGLDNATYVRFRLFVWNILDRPTSSTFALV